jgi:uncharacterized protein YqgC (DUF456 family)
MLLIMLVDFLAPMLGAKKYRASKYGILGAFLGLIVGIIVFGFWGIVLGPIIGAFVFELIAIRRPKRAFKAAVGAFIGFVAGNLIKAVYVLIVAGLFIASLF